MEKITKIIIAVGIIVIAGLAIFLVKSNLFITAKAVKNENAVNIAPVKINYDNIEKELSRLSLVRDMPEKGEIMLMFYNFNTRQRQWEKSYLITKNGFKEGSSESPDFTIMMHSKYLTVLTNQNLCGVIAKAKETGDFGMETGMSKAGLLWKYKSMMKYKSCFGL